MQSITQKEFQKYTLKAVRDTGGIYFVQFFPPDDEDYEFDCRYDIGRQKMLSSDREFSKEQLDIIHDEVAEQFANDCDTTNSEPDSYENYGFSENDFLN